MTRRITLLVFLCVSLSALGGCKRIKLLFGGYTVTEPEKETPQWVVQQVLKAAAKEPFEDAFNEYSKYLHSSELESAAAMKFWETQRFPALRRKHAKYLRPEGEFKFAYKVKEEKEIREDYMQLRVQIKTSDVPTPCHLFRDPKADNNWRIKINCLN